LKKALYFELGCTPLHAFRIDVHVRQNLGARRIWNSAQNSIRSKERMHEISTTT